MSLIKMDVFAYLCVETAKDVRTVRMDRVVAFPSVPRVGDYLNFSNGPFQVVAVNFEDSPPDGEPAIGLAVSGDSEYRTAENFEDELKDWEKCGWLRGSDNIRRRNPN